MQNNFDMKFEFIPLLKKHSLDSEMFEKKMIKKILSINKHSTYLCAFLYQILNLTNSMTLQNGNLSSSLGHFLQNILYS